MGGKSHVTRLVSAGGVVTRSEDVGREVLLCGRIAPKVWALPKGTPEVGETHEQTALREVREETGLEAMAKEFIGTIDYWFNRTSDGGCCYKTVHYFLMTVTGGDIAFHDCEFDTVRWFRVGDALKNMTYRNEVRVVEKGLSMVEE